MLHWLKKELIKGILQMLLLLINWLHLSLASALIEHSLSWMAWFCIPYTKLAFSQSKSILMCMIVNLFDGIFFPILIIESSNCNEGFLGGFLGLSFAANNFFKLILRILIYYLNLKVLCASIYQNLMYLDSLILLGFPSNLIF